MYLRVNIESVNEGMLVPVIRKMAAGILRELEADEWAIDRVMSVVTEACSNVVRHAYDAPALYEVGLEYSLEKVCVSVRDYGRGFDPSSVGEPKGEHGGYGIKFMREESSTFTIESTPGKGTVVKAEVPVTYRSERARLKVLELPTL